jgi:AcrR family transcriptional regulator
MAKSRTSKGAVRSEETTDAILAAASSIIEEKGYAGFTLDAVVKRAGSSKPTIYRWWNNKGALIRDVYERRGESSLKQPDTGDLAEDLTIHLTELWRWWRSSRSGEMLRSLISELHLHPELLEEFRTSFLQRRSRVLRMIIHSAAARGTEIDASKIDAGIELLTGLSWLRLLTANLEAEEQISPAVAIVVAGISA